MADILADSWLSVGEVPFDTSADVRVSVTQAQPTF